MQHHKKSSSATKLMSSKLLQDLNTNESLVQSEKEINYKGYKLCKAFAKFPAEALKAGNCTIKEKKKMIQYICGLPQKEILPFLVQRIKIQNYYLKRLLLDMNFQDI